MKVRIIQTGRDPVRAQEMVQLVIDQIEKSGVIIGMTDSGMRIALYYVTKEDNPHNEKQNDTPKLTSAVQATPRGSKARVNKPKSSRKTGNA